MPTQPTRATTTSARPPASHPFTPPPSARVQSPSLLPSPTARTFPPHDSECWANTGCAHKAWACRDQETPKRPRSRQPTGRPSHPRSPLPPSSAYPWTTGRPPTPARHHTRRKAPAPPAAAPRFWPGTRPRRRLPPPLLPPRRPSADGRPCPQRPRRHGRQPWPVPAPPTTTARHTRRQELASAAHRGRPAGRHAGRKHPARPCRRRPPDQRHHGHRRAARVHVTSWGCPAAVAPPAASEGPSRP